MRQENRGFVDAAAPQPCRLLIRAASASATGMVITTTLKAMIVVLNIASRNSGSLANSTKLAKPTNGLRREMIFHWKS